MSLPSSMGYLAGDPAVSSSFLFEVDGMEIGLFGAVTGLAVSAQTVDVIEGGQNGFAHRLPGRLEWPNIVFTRGLTQADNLFEWMNRTSGEGFAAAGHKLTRSTGAVTALGSDGSRLRSWSLDGVFPVRWKGPDFSGTSQDPLSEELEIAHHGFRSSNVS